MTNDVVLRDVENDDLPSFFEHQLDPEATRMAAFPSRDKDTFMAHWTKILGDDNNIIKTILYEGRVAGNIVSFIQGDEREVGYWIGKDYWGKGIATKALAESLKQVKTRPLYAYVAKHNIGSTRVLEKCGFTLHGEDKGFPNASGEAVDELILILNTAA